MASFSLDRLTTPLTTTEVRDSIYSVLAIVGVNTTMWKPGAVVRTIIAAVAIVVAALSSLIALIARSGFLELAEGEWLSHKAHYDYGTDRIEATFAAGNVKVSNSGGGVYELDVDDLIVRNALTKKTYRNTAAVTIGALASNVVVPVAATESGSASSALVGEITEFETPLLGLTVTNDAALIGLDAEDDAALRLRASETLGALSPMGPPDAYSHAARNAKRADGTPIGVTRVRTVKDGFGNVTIYVATASGGLSAPDVADVDDAIQLDAAPLAVTANTVSATPLPIPISYEVWLYNDSGLTEAQIKSAIDAELSAFISAEPIGGNVIPGAPGRVYRTGIEAAIGRTRVGDTKLKIFRVNVASPSADVEFQAHEVPTLGALTTIAINQIAAPGVA